MRDGKNESQWCIREWEWERVMYEKERVRVREREWCMQERVWEREWCMQERERVREREREVAEIREKLVCIFFVPRLMFFSTCWNFGISSICFERDPATDWTNWTRASYNKPTLGLGCRIAQWIGFSFCNLRPWVWFLAFPIFILDVAEVNRQRCCLEQWTAEA